MGQKTFENKDQMLEFRLALERYRMLVSLAMAFQIEVQKQQQMIQSFSQILGVPIDKELKFDFDTLTVSWTD